jgi:hypothetical protein
MPTNFMGSVENLKLPFNEVLCSLAFLLLDRKSLSRETYCASKSH